MTPRSKPRIGRITKGKRKQGRGADMCDTEVSKNYGGLQRLGAKRALLGLRLQVPYPTPVFAGTHLLPRIGPARVVIDYFLSYVDSESHAKCPLPEIMPQNNRKPPARRVRRRPKEAIEASRSSSHPLPRLKSLQNVLGPEPRRRWPVEGLQRSPPQSSCWETKRRPQG